MLKYFDNLIQAAKPSEQILMLDEVTKKSQLVIDLLTSETKRSPKAERLSFSSGM